MTADCIGLDLSTRPSSMPTVEGDNAEEEQRMEERRKCSYLIDDLLRADRHSDHLQDPEQFQCHGHSDINEASQHSNDQLRPGWLSS